MTWDKLILCSGGGALPEPRDWSPRMDQWKARLQVFQSMVPESMLVSIEEVREANWPHVTWMVENGFAFILRIGISYHCIYVDMEGKVRIHNTVKAYFRGPW